MTKFRPEHRQLIRKFYTTIAVCETAQGWNITLDGQTVKTPMKHLLSLPNKALADDVASEWASQDSVINFIEMPITRLCCVATDQTPCRRDECILEIEKYAQTDLICYRSESPDLNDRQTRLWDPFIEWSKTVLDAPLNVTQGILAIEQPVKSLAAFRHHATLLDDFRLTGLFSAVKIMTSAVLGFALLYRDHSLECIWESAQLELNYQAEKWGTDQALTSVKNQDWRDLVACLTVFNKIR